MNHSGVNNIIETVNNYGTRVYNTRFWTQFPKNKMLEQRLFIGKI